MTPDFALLHSPSVYVYICNHIYNSLAITMTTILTNIIPLNSPVLNVTQ